MDLEAVLDGLSADPDEADGYERDRWRAAALALVPYIAKRRLRAAVMAAQRQARIATGDEDA